MDRIKNILFTLASIGDIDKKSMTRRLKRIRARHAEISAVYSLENGKPTPRLWKILQELIPLINHRGNYLDLLRNRPNVPDYVFNFPGEHYRMLPALIEIMDAKIVVEIGTYTGLSACAMLPQLSIKRKLYSFDIIPFDKFTQTVLTPRDFSDNFEQIICDISDFESLKQYKSIFSNADLIFLDACKDGRFERGVLNNFNTLGLKEGAILVFDDIRQWNMLQIWHDIEMPKLDVTSVGHFTGTGLVEWKNNTKCFSRES